MGGAERSRDNGVKGRIMQVYLNPYPCPLTRIDRDHGAGCRSPKTNGAMGEIMTKLQWVNRVVIHDHNTNSQEFFSASHG